MIFQSIFIFKDLLAIITFENLGQVEDLFNFLQTAVTVFTMSEDEDLIQVCTLFLDSLKENFNSLFV